MKIQVLSRNPEDYLRETSDDLNKIFRNFDKDYHPMHIQREYSRALNAVKLDRMFAKPFVSCLSGHRDGVTKICSNTNRVSWLASGCMNGEIRLWDLKTGFNMAHFDAHTSKINGLCFSPPGSVLISSGLDSLINIFTITDGFNVKTELSDKRLVSGSLNSLDYSRNETLFGSGGDSIVIWELSKKDPVKVYQLGTEVVNALAFNRIEENIIAACTSDRGLSVYDTRQKFKCSKLILNMQGNALSWHPLEATNVVLASEDSNCYLFDVRYLKKPCKTFVGHANSVLDVAVSPTGQEFVSASYDRSIRIFPFKENKSREVYHTKNMQRVFCVSYTADAQFVVSGSDEMNIRLWKTNASKPLGYLRPRQRVAINYSRQLIQKYQFHPEIHKINSHRHLPKHLFNLAEKKKVEKECLKRKRENAKIFNKRNLSSNKTVIHIEE